LFIAAIAGVVSLAETALTVFVNVGPAAFSTDVFTSGVTFWNPVTCFGSASTVYFEGFASGGSVVKTSAASTWPLSSAVYDSPIPSGTNDAFVIPYCFV
jgi:hypothetical protein